MKEHESTASRAGRYIAWMEENRRVPSRASSDAAERSLASWYSHLPTGDLQSPADAEVLRQVKGVRSTCRIEWSRTRRAEEYKSWTLANGRLPLMRSSDPVERSLYRFWAKLRSGNLLELNPFSVQVREELIAFRASQPKRKPSNARTSGLVMARRVADFHSAQGRLPVFGVEDERLVYNSLRVLRNAARSGTISPDALEIAAQVPGLFEAVRRNPRTELDKLRTWCRMSGRLPRHTIRGSALSAQDEMEQHLGRWMYRHVNRRPGAVETVETQAVRAAILEIRDRYPAFSECQRGAKQPTDRPGIAA